MSSFEERRQQALENTRVLIGRAQIADRQVSDILYQNPYHHANASRPVPVPVAVVKPNQASRISPPPAQQAALEEAENWVMRT